MRFFGYGMILLLSLMSGSLFAKEIPIPALTQRVTDLTDTITNSESTQLSDQIVNFENKTGHQLAVLVVKPRARKLSNNMPHAFLNSGNWEIRSAMMVYYCSSPSKTTLCD